MTEDEFAEDVAKLVNQLKPILAGHPPGRQSAALADCLAIWAAGHGVLGDPMGTKLLREQLLSQVFATVRQLVEPNARAMGTWHE